MILNNHEITSEVNDNTSEISATTRHYITARRRSLSGGAVASKSEHRMLNNLLKNEKNKFQTIDQSIQLKNGHDSFDSTDCNHSETENVRDTGDLNSLSSERDSNKCHKSNSLLFTNFHRTGVSATTKIKHFLAEHIVKIHPCHHPEYHFNKKHSDISMANENMKSLDSQDIDIPEQSSLTSSASSSSKEITSPRPKSAHDNHLPNYTHMATTVLDKIRHMNIQSIIPVYKLHSDNTTPNHSNVNDTNIFFPYPEPNPYKLPKVASPSTIMFSSKLIASHKAKRHRLAHSVSLDPGFRLSDACKFSPEKDKWEKKISGYLDTSTPTGAALTAINFGLKRVTETDKFVMITKSLISSPNEFLEEGISHLQDPKTLHCTLMYHTNCYDLMPDSGKIIIIDSQMQINKAIEALEDNVVRAAPIWNSERQEFVGLLTVNDVIPLLLHLHQLRKEDSSYEEDSFQFDNFSSITVERSLNMIPRLRTLQGHMAGVSPETSLYSVANMLCQMRISKVMVIDSLWSGNPLFLLTDLRILTFISLKIRTMSTEPCFIYPIQSESTLLDSKLEMLNSLSEDESMYDDLCISTSNKIQYIIYNNSSLTDVLRAMSKSYHTCALVLDDEQILNNDQDSQFFICDVITVSDILHLVMINKHKDSTITTSQIIQFRNLSQYQMTFRDPVISCNINDSVQYLIDTIIKERASFALVRTSEDISSSTVAVISSIDILNYISKQSSTMNSLPFHTSIISDINKVKRPITKYSTNRSRQNSDCFGSNKIQTKQLDDTLEEVFNIDVS